VVGGKTGFTDNCGFCLITAAEREGRRLVVVVLHDTRERWLDDTVGLIEHGFTQLAMSAAPAPEPVAPAGEDGDESSPARVDAAAPLAGERPAARALPVTLLATLLLALLSVVIVVVARLAARLEGRERE
jgi:D-alanyl-D-alanine carboxypeptidase (penicillin-binding protein 5/6)